MPRSAASVLLNGFHPASLRRASVRKWLELPPSGIGSRSASSPGSTQSSQNEYSAENTRVGKLSRPLR